VDLKKCHTEAACSMLNLGPGYWVCGCIPFGPFLMFLCALRVHSCEFLQIIVAVFDDNADFSSPFYVKCRRPAPPWYLNNSACYDIDLFKRDTLQYASVISPMNNPGFTWTVDMNWGAQCGNLTSMDAMISLKLNPAVAYYTERITCCRLYRV
jgi:hypothetical protein